MWVVRGVATVRGVAMWVVRGVAMVDSEECGYGR